MHSRLLLTALLSLGSIFSLPEQAASQQCDSAGGLLFLGTNRDDSRSVWLSRTGRGAFELEAAQGNQTVDQWNRRSPALRLSLSPVVSNGNGGVHRLLDVTGARPCLIDSKNQKPIFTLPPARPKPPIEILPPIGGVPTLPVLPERPIEPRPPGAGPMPPERPIEPQPPGGGPTLPVLPERPIEPQPPGAGPTPPERPIEPQPPGGGPTLPVLPERPIEPQPPGGGPTLPVLPERPIEPQPPGGELPDEVIQERSVGEFTNDCIDPRSSQGQEGAAGSDKPICSDTSPALEADNTQAPEAQVPLTPGRFLVTPTEWNIWANTSLASASDDRFGRDQESKTGSLSFGADRHAGTRAIAGFMLSFDRSQSDGFDGGLDTDTKGFSFGPYAAYRLSDNWAVDATLSYGMSETDMKIVSLEGDIDAKTYTAQVNLNGQYLLEEVILRPKVSVYFARTDTDAYDLRGQIRGNPVSVGFRSDSYNYGTLEVSNEISRVFSIDQGQRIMPYAEVGVLYEFERPYDGEILGGDLSLREPSPWSGSLRGGVRAQLSDKILVDANLGYLSFGQSGLDEVEANIFFSIAF
jgi:hypothetical protein